MITATGLICLLVGWPVLKYGDRKEIESIEILGAALVFMGLLGLAAGVFMWIWKVMP